MDVADDRPVVPGVVLEQLIGEGAHAQVWRALDDQTGETVAVKIAANEPDAVARLAQEAALLRRFDHPHLVRLLRTVEPAPGALALVLEFAGGGTVAALVAARGGLDPSEVTTVVVPVARALARLHRDGLVHGDVTAANVLLTDDGRPVLADLGAGTRTDGAAVWGTPGWVDPAVVSGARSILQPAGDVWALGALIRFCLTGDTSGAATISGNGHLVDHDPAAFALLEVASSCCRSAAALRPTAAQVPAMAWQACSPTAIRLLDAHAAAAPTAAVSAPELTRRIRADAVAPQATDSARRRSLSRSGVRVRPGRIGPLKPSAPKKSSAASQKPVTAAARARRTATVSGRPSRPLAAPASRSGSVCVSAGAGVRRGGVQRAVPWVALGTAVALVCGAAAAYALSRIPEPQVNAASAVPVSVSPTPTPSLLPASATASRASVDQVARADQVGQLEQGGQLEQVDQLVRQMADARARALATASTRALDAVDLAGSPAMTADRALVAALAGHRLRLQGLTFTVARVQRAPSAVSPSASAASADVLDVTAAVAASAHHQVDAQGHFVADVPAQPMRAVRLHLVHTSVGWRVASAVAA